MKEKAMKILLNEYPMTKLEIVKVGEDGCVFTRENNYTFGINKKGYIKTMGIISFRVEDYEVVETVIERKEG